MPRTESLYCNQFNPIEAYRSIYLSIYHLIRAVHLFADSSHPASQPSNHPFALVGHQRNFVFYVPQYFSTWTDRILINFPINFRLTDLGRSFP